MMLRAIREGYRALAALGVPVTPGSHRIVTWIPEPVLLALIRRRLVSREARFMAGHAADARAEMKVLAEDFHALVASSDVSTPALDRLVTHLDPSADGLPDGSARLALRWGGVWGLGAGLMAAV